MDFPDRFNAFRDALADLSDADVNAGFEWGLRHCQEFPVPAQIRQFASEAAKQNQARLAEESLKNQRQIEDRIKDSRFEATDAETRRREFAEMMAKVAAEKAIPDAKVRLGIPDSETRVIPPHIAAAKGPEWEARIRQQAEDLKRQAEAERANQ